MKTSPRSNDAAVLAAIRSITDLPSEADELVLTVLEKKRLQGWMRELNAAAWRDLCETVFAIYDRARVQRIPLDTRAEGVTQHVVLPRFDASHDSLHVERVLWTALLIAVREERLRGTKVDLNVVALAALGHDLVSSVKTDEIKKQDPIRSAQMFLELPTRAGITWQQVFPRLAQKQLEAAVTKARTIIEGCSATHGDTPTTPEEQAVRDADLLECIGVIGALRFASSSDDLPRRLVRTLSVLPESDELDGWGYSVDAVLHRGLGYADRLVTETAREIARVRAVAARAMFAALAGEMRPLAAVANALGMHKRVPDKA